MEQTNQTKHNISHVISTHQAILVNVAAQVFVNQSTITLEQFLKILLDSSKHIAEYTHFINEALKMGMLLSSTLEIADNLIDISKEPSPVSAETEEFLKMKELDLKMQINKLIEYHKNNPKDNGKS